MADPWVALSTIASATDTLRLGPMVTPLARRRVQKLARETARATSLIIATSSHRLLIAWRVLTSGFVAGHARLAILPATSTAISIARAARGEWVRSACHSRKISRGRSPGRSS